MRKRSGFFSYWPSQIKVFIILLILVASGILLAAADFGESSDSLGQITDEYDTLDNISVRVDIARNATLNAMELNRSGVPGPAFEDFTGYTEVDAEGDLTVTVNKIEWDTQRRDANNYVYFDFGAGYWGDFVCNFTYVVSDIEAGDASGIAVNWIFAIADQVSRAGIGGANVGILVEIGQQAAVDDRFRFRLGVLPAATFGAFRNIGTFYISIDKSGTTVRFRAWSDSAHTALLETIIIIGNVETFRYISIAIGYNVGTDPADHSSGYVENLWIGDYGGGYSTEGYFITTDYLSSINGSSLVHLTNTTIPGGTGITVEYSDDNSTWVLNDWDPLFGGYEAVDLRDLNYSAGFWSRFNMSGTSALTPRLYQSRLVTTEGPPAGAAGPGAPGMNVSRETVIYNLTEIGVTVGTLDSGDLNSTLDIDGDLYNVSELVGAPGMQISGNFSGVDPDAGCLWVVLYAHYDGNLNHDFDIEVWNFTSSAWVEDSHITDGTGLAWFNSTIYALRIPSEFLSGGEVRVRLDHEAPGNINHDLFIEYWKLLAEIPAGPTPGAGAGTVIIESDFPWIAIAIILMCVAYLLFRPK